MEAANKLYVVCSFYPSQCVRPRVRHEHMCKVETPIWQTHWVDQTDVVLQLWHWKYAKWAHCCDEWSLACFGAGAISLSPDTRTSHHEQSRQLGISLLILLVTGQMAWPLPLHDEWTSSFALQPPRGIDVYARSCSLPWRHRRDRTQPVFVHFFNMSATCCHILCKNGLTVNHMESLRPSDKDFCVFVDSNMDFLATKDNKLGEPVVSREDSSRTLCFKKVRYHPYCRKVLFFVLYDVFSCAIYSL